ncbi:MAG: hypothetical protein FJZ57_08385 [Chlamydiae bacterium]|nr:hypothetical protein [Chlamydiota bacterium]
MPAPGQPADASFPGEFIPSAGEPDCTDRQAWGIPSTLYSYIFKNNADEATYPPDACRPYYHQTAQIDSLQVNQNIIGSGEIDIGGDIVGSGHRLSNKKNFDITHPNKPGWRLRHTCLEGPENAVYFRGRLKDNTIIDLPKYWIGFVDPETITVTLTQIGSSQDLIVEKVEWGTRIVIKSGNASAIDCYYLVHGERLDGEKLIVEYEGQSTYDYPGDNKEYNINT